MISRELLQRITLNDGYAAAGIFYPAFLIEVFHQTADDLPGRAHIARNLLVCQMNFVPAVLFRFLQQEDSQPSVGRQEQHLLHFPPAYLAFTAAYGTVTGAFTAFSGIATSAAQIKPILEMAEPILQTEPETAEGREIVTKLSGSIELANISFRYYDTQPYVINGLNLKIRSGEYVAIVGKTGCGKSTLLRLLLGFETPEKGAIYYDRKDLRSLDLGSLRRKMGVVTQDGSLFHGDIYSNITVSAPHLSLDDAWDAAEKAGIADDIRAMPMGMQTFISEGQGGISGGQKQRIMIARAIAPKPKILLFDEATSALDNKTQKQVSDALAGLDCTRIVIAHRLSTVKDCDRILVLEDGKIVEEGDYDTLIQKGGFFAELVERQRID